MKTQTPAAPAASLPNFNRFSIDIDGTEAVTLHAARTECRDGYLIERHDESVTVPLADLPHCKSLLARVSPAGRERLLAMAARAAQGGAA